MFSIHLCCFVSLESHFFSDFSVLLLRVLLILRFYLYLSLQEPTTGLDSSTASSLISLLKVYAAKSNKSVIASIHQPSSQMFFQFDKLLLLSDGQVYFHTDSERLTCLKKYCGLCLLWIFYWAILFLQLVSLLMDGGIVDINPLQLTVI